MIGGHVILTFIEAKHLCLSTSNTIVIFQEKNLASKKSPAASMLY